MKTRENPPNMKTDAGSPHVKFDAEVGALVKQRRAALGCDSLCLMRGLVACVITLFVAGCAALYVDRAERVVSIDSNPQGAYVWDSSGTKLLGQTPMQFTLKPRDYTVHRLFITKSDYYDESVRTYDQMAGLGIGLLDAVLIVPFFVDMITLTPCYGKYEGTSFSVNLTPTSIPRPGAIVSEVYQQDAARAQAMVGAAQAVSQGVTQGANAFSGSMAQQQQQNHRPIVVKQPAVQSQSAQAAVPQTTTPVSKPNTKRWCSKSYKSGGVHGEWDIRFSPGCPACRGTINW